MATGVPKVEVSTEVALPCKDCGIIDRCENNQPEAYGQYARATYIKIPHAETRLVSYLFAQSVPVADSRYALRRKLGHKYATASRGELRTVRRAWVRDRASLVIVDSRGTVRRVY